MQLRQNDMNSLTLKDATEINNMLSIQKSKGNNHKIPLKIGRSICEMKSKTVYHQRIDVSEIQLQGGDKVALQTGLSALQS